MNLLDSHNPNFSYVDFLKQLERAKKEFDFPDLDVHETKLFETIVLLCHEAKACTVSYVMSAVDYASHSATHRRLKKLKHVGYIHFIMDDLDNRLKYVALTPLAASYLNLMGQLIVSAGGGGLASAN